MFPSVPGCLESRKQPDRNVLQRRSRASTPKKVEEIGGEAGSLHLAEELSKGSECCFPLYYQTSSHSSRASSNPRSQRLNASMCRFS